MKSMLKLSLFALAAVLLCSLDAQAGPLRRLFGGHAGCSSCAQPAAQQAPQWFDHWQVNVRGTPAASACPGGCEPLGTPYPLRNNCRTYACPANGGIGGCGCANGNMPTAGIHTIADAKGPFVLDGKPFTVPLVPTRGFAPTFAVPTPVSVPRQMPACPGGRCPVQR